MNNQPVSDIRKNKDHASDRKVILLPILLGAFFLLIDYFLSWFFFLRVAPSFKERTLELGRAQISPYPEDYLTGLDIFSRNVIVDISEVDLNRTGSYEVYLTGKNRSYSYRINVVDTIAPEIAAYDMDDTALELGVEYSLDTFLDSVYDESGGFEMNLFCSDDVICDIKLDVPSDYVGESFRNQKARLEKAWENEKVTFDETGIKEISLVVTDGSGNASSVTLNLNVLDTLAPVFEEFSEEEAPVFATGRYYSAEDFVRNISDNSDFFSTAIIEGDDTLARYMTAEAGPRVISLYAVDEAGNEVRHEITAEFDEPPVFIALRNKHIRRGSKVDLFDHVIAVDNTDGNVTDTIVIDDGGFDPSIAGDYVVKYSAHDSNGLVTDQEITLTVGDEGYSAFYLTKEERELLCRYDYFTYEALDSYDYDATVELVRPTLVNMIYRYGNGGYNAGSGFIYMIDDDYTYIVTCSHVMEKMDEKIEVMFCDSDATKIMIRNPAYTQLSPDNEVAMFKIDTSAIPGETLVELREILCDPDIYSKLKRNQELIAYSGHWMNEDPLIRTLNIKDLNSTFNEDAVNCVRTTHNVVGGMSGTAVVDEKGRLVGVVEGYISYWDFASSDYIYDGYSMRVDGLNELYTRVSGK